MPRYKGGFAAPHIPGVTPQAQRVDLTPDWMRSLLPDGGKVSLTVHGPPNAAANAPQPDVTARAQPAQSPTAFVTGGQFTTAADTGGAPDPTVTGAVRIVGQPPGTSAAATGAAATTTTQSATGSQPAGDTIRRG